LGDTSSLFTQLSGSRSGRDGVRALAAVDETGWRLWGRERADYTARYPELDLLRRL
jgi:hypothetical protein